MAFESFLFSESLFNSDNKFTAKLLLLIQVCDLVNAIIIILIKFTVVVLTTRTLMATCFTNTLHFRSTLRFVIIRVGALHRFLVSQLSP